MEKIKDVINELKLFSEDIITLYEPIDPELIHKFEKKYDLKLPEDFIVFLKCTNGLELMANKVYGITFNDSEEDLNSVYYREHNEVLYPQYKNLVPFSGDGRGNFYCLDVKTNNTNLKECEIVFWASNYIYSEKDLPEVTHSSFSDWVKECMIEWTLEDFDYNGNER
jgi:hypothetical protein